MKIIKANEKHIDQITVLFKSYGQFFGQKNDLIKSKYFLRERIGDQNTVIFMAITDDGIPTGFIQLYIDFSPATDEEKEISLKDLFVVKKFRKRGIGTSLLEKAKEFSFARGASGISLEVVNENSIVRLCERLGWHSSKEKFQYYWKTNSNPLVQQKYINKSMGFGVFSVREIKRGDVVLRGKSIYKTSIRDHKTLQINDKEHSRLDTPFENTNHSCDPNVGVQENQFDGYDLIALRDIESGEQITMDYCMTEWESTLGFCGCNAANCRKEINGAKYLEEDVLMKYNGFIADYIKRKKAIVE